MKKLRRSALVVPGATAEAEAITKTIAKAGRFLAVIDHSLTIESQNGYGYVGWSSCRLSSSLVVVVTSSRGRGEERREEVARERVDREARERERR